MQRRWTMLAIGCGLWGAVAVAGERRVPEREVPAAVLAAVTRLFPAAKRVGFAAEVEGGKTVWEVQLVDGRRKLDLDLSPAGELLATEEVVPIAELPAAVHKGLAASPRFGAWTLRRAEKVTRGETVEYELVVSDGRRRAEVVFDPAGTLVRSEP